MFKNILDLFFPVQCLGCNREKQFLCDSCLDKIPPHKKQSVKNLIIAGDYSYPLLKKAIHQFKYNFVKGLSLPLSQLMIKKIKKYNFDYKNSVLLPVPLHPRRLRWRGFNQAELLAQEIGKNLNIAVANNILIRTKHNLPQVKISDAYQRKQNIQNAFILNPRFPVDLKNKIIILVDDVCTTGATLNQCAEVLKPLKPKAIWALVLAKG